LVRFEGEIDLPAGADELWLEARPARQLRGGEDERETLHYAALPCAVIACELQAQRDTSDGPAMRMCSAA